MKLLEGLVAIQWHGYDYEEVWITNDGCLVGANGAGKSVLVDAIQTVLVADLRRIRYNPSAHEHVKRDLLGYLRWKIGHDDQVFLRKSDITSYVVLQFYDTERSEPFLLGMVADSYADNVTYTHKFFRIDGVRYRRELFMDGDRPRNIRALRAYLATEAGARVYDSVEDYQKDLLARMGGIDSRFFTLFPKAIAFEPILDVRAFVHRYMLDPEPLNLQAMRDNLAHWKRLQEKAETVRQQIQALKQILQEHAAMRRDQRATTVTGLSLSLLERERASERAGALEADLDESQVKLEEVRQRLEQVGREQEALRESEENLQARLLGHDAYQEYRHLQRELQQATDRLKRLEDRRVKLLQHMRRAREALVHVLQAEERRDLLEPKEEQALWDLVAGLERLEEPEGAIPASQALEGAAAVLERVARRLREKAEPLREERRRQEQEVQRLRREVAQLREGRRIYPKSLEALRRLIREKVGEEPTPLCELAEVRTPRWRDAVEGFLNTRRFDLILRPELFDDALAVYEREKREHGIYGIGLVNTGKVAAEAGRAEAGSLAEEVVSENPYAQAYLVHLMGRLIKCETEQELKQHRQAITPTCMTYRNHTARQIHFEVYRIPYMGKDAIRLQREAREAELQQATARLEALRRELEGLEAIERRIQDRRTWFAVLEGNREELAERLDLAARVTRLEEDLKRVDTAEWAELEARLNETRRQAAERAEEWRRLTREAAALEGQVDQIRSDLELAQHALQAASEAYQGLVRETVAAWGEKAPQEASDIYLRFVDRLGAGGDLDFEAVKTRLEGRKSHFEREAQNRREELIRLLTEYNRAYHLGGGSDPEDVSAFQEEHDRLEETDLPRYQDQIREARTQAEQEFKEHVLYRLKEHIERARQTFDSLNDVAKRIDFHGERYRFKVTPNPEYRRFYDAIMDEENFEGYSLFNTAYQEKHREVLEELFTRIQESPLDSAEASLDELTDYRRYLEYDMRILYPDGNEASLARICREQSGGETQTPFYVAMAASFLHLYQVGINPNALRLVVFDEAFNKMDSDRSQAVIRFFQGLGLQLLIAAPENKMEDLSPYLETTILCFRDDRYRLWTERFRHAAQEAAAGEDGAEAPPGDHLLPAGPPASDGAGSP